MRCLVASLLLLAVSASQAQPAGKTRVKHAWPVGVYTLTQATESETRTVVGAQEIPSRSSEQAVWEMAVADAGKGEKKATLTLIRIVKTLKAERVTAFDSGLPDGGQDTGQAFVYRPLVGLPVQVSLDGDDTLLEVVGLDRLWNDLAGKATTSAQKEALASVRMGLCDKTLEQALRRLEAMMPKEAVAVGDSWKAAIRLDLPVVGEIKARYDCRLQAIEPAASGAVALLACDGAYESVNPKTVKFNGMDMTVTRLQVQEKSTLKVDVATGLAGTDQRSLALAADIKAKGPDGRDLAVQVRTTQTGKVTIALKGSSQEGDAARLGQSSPAPAPVAAPASPQPPDKATFDEARRHLVRGAAAIEMAKNDSDLALAADEFRKAVTIYPAWAFAWMNLGQVQARLGRLPEAMASYKRFLALAPEDKEAGKVSDELIKLEFRLEQTARIRNRGGIWVGEGGMPFQAKADGNTLVLKTARQRMSARELDANEFMGGEAGIPVREFRLELQGARVTGTSTRSEVVAGKCTVPAETVEVEGTYDEAAGRLSLRLPRTRFQSRTSVNLFLDPVDCRGVTNLGKDEVKVELLGPLPEGGLGIPVDLSYVPGGVLIRHGWQGHLGVGSYTAPLTDRGKALGFQKMDEVVSIDGVAIKDLGPTEAIRRLRGPVGSEVVLGVLHKKAKEPETLKVTRVPVAPPAADQPYVYEVWVN